MSRPPTQPMLATLIDAPFDSEEFIFEIKFDGYRALANVEKGHVELYSRNLLSFNIKFAPIVEILESIKEQVTLDGEIIAYGKNGIASFELLQNSDNGKTILEYVVFDILHLKGKSLLEVPLIKRKTILEKFLKKYPSLTYSTHIEKNGIAFFEKAAKAQLEGIIAKRKESFYVPGGRSRDWLKIKNVMTDEAVIVGFTEPRGGRKYFGSLVLAQYKKGKLSFIGHTGTGFSDKALKDLHAKLKPLMTDTAPIDDEIEVHAPITWLKPRYVAQVKFTEWTKAGLMRHPVYMGLREDKISSKVNKEKLVSARSIKK